ncbi:30S ribosomal protein S17 [Candidatus Mycoplasma mahonii]
MERTSRKILTGKVVSTKNAKTINVAVETYIKHPLYGKRFLSTKKFAAHDEKEIANDGDVVQIAETRPLSASKRFRFVKVVKSAVKGDE